jgi:hypothetical protein
VENSSPAVLHAYAAGNLAQELYNSSQASGGRDQFGSGNKFITPIIASARVYVGTTTGVGVFGLLDQTTLSPLQVWRDNHFGNPSNIGAGADNTDVIGDGLPNLIKYALGLNPFASASQSQTPAGSVLEDSGQNYLMLTVNRGARLTDVAYTVEVSGDRQTWSSGTPNTVTITDTATQLVVRDNTPVGPAPRFIRLAVSPVATANSATGAKP